MQEKANGTKCFSEDPAFGRQSFICTFWVSTLFPGRLNRGEREARSGEYGKGHRQQERLHAVGPDGSLPDHAGQLNRN